LRRGTQRAGTGRSVRNGSGWCLRSRSGGHRWGSCRGPGGVIAGGSSHWVWHTQTNHARASTSQVLGVWLMWRNRRNGLAVTAEEAAGLVVAGFSPVVVRSWLAGGYRERRRWRALLREGRR
jgi:hypothetical protein